MDSPTSTTNINSIVKAQLVFLLSTLTEENFERNQIEIRSLSEQHGVDAYIHFLRRLFAHAQPKLTNSTTPAGVSESTAALTFRLLVQETQRLSRDPFLADRFRDGVDKGEGEFFRTFDLTRFADRVRLAPLEKLVLASSFVAGATRKDLSAQAANMIKAEFEGAVLSLCHNPSFDQSDLSPNQLSKLMANLLSDLPTDSPILDAAQRQALITAAQTKYGKETISPILHRILPTLSLPAGTSLVQVLVQLGPEITGEPDTVRALLARFGLTDAAPPREAQVIEIISTLARLGAEATADVSSLVRALSSFQQAQINWANVVQSFDLPDRQRVDTATLKLVIAILHHSPDHAVPHAVNGLWGVWNNQLYQLRLLDGLLSLPADTFNFVALPGKRIVTVEDVAVASPTIKGLAAHVQGQTWNSLDLFEVLVKAADSESPEIHTCIRDMLDKAIKISAELVHMGLLQVSEPNWNEIRQEYCKKLLRMFLQGHPNHQLVFMRIWQIQPDYLMTAFNDFYKEDTLNVTRILDVAQDLKILESILNVKPSAFTLDVATLASRREYLNLDKWLSDNVTEYGLDFLRTLAGFLEKKMAIEKNSRFDEDPTVESRATVALSPHTITIILRVIRTNQAQFPPEDSARLGELRYSCFQNYPRLMSITDLDPEEAGTTVIGYPSDIEEECEEIYQRMYDEQMTIEDVILMLERYKSSSNPREVEVYSCMVHFLFDEFRFFSSYPPRQLTMTGYFFGSLIQHSLIDMIPLGIALRYVLDGLVMSTDSNLFKFGITALSRFESRIADWPPMVDQLLKIPTLADHRPDLVSTLQRLRAAGSNGDAPASPVMSVVQGIEPPPSFTALKPDTIDSEIQVPVEELSDRILFIVNNLAPNNFEAKLKEMKDLYEEEFSHWFANYLVDQRISTEPNNHTLYLRFLDSLERVELFHFILHETLGKALALLNSEGTMLAGPERLLLKNVGSWLGAITLARDRPIRHKNFAFKELLLEGFDSGKLAVAIPFVCKVLEGCTKSKVFKPPNPWLMGVMSLLAELYHFGDLKLNFKFEIEVLCKALDINLEDLEPSTSMRNRPMHDQMAGPPLPEYANDIEAIPMLEYSTASNMASNDSNDPVMSLGPSSPSDAQRNLGPHLESILVALSQHVIINAQFVAHGLGTAVFKRAVQLAIDRAVREIIVLAVERSATIAAISTKELVTKDFAPDPSEERVRKAGQLMARKLAGALALVTCKDALKSNLDRHLRLSLGETGFGDVSQQDQVIMFLVQDNLDIACSAVEKAAMERVVGEVEDTMATSFELRRRHRELGGRQPFWDANAPTSHFNTQNRLIPEALKIRSNGLQPSQWGVYEDFATELKRRPMSRAGTSHTPTHYAPSPAPDSGMNHNYVSQQEIMDRFAAITHDLDAVMLQLPVQSVGSLPQNHDVRHLIRMILSLADQATERQRTPMLMSQKIVQLLYKTPSPLGREVYTHILEQLCATFEEVSREARTWLEYAEDERKYNVPVTVLLLRSGLIKLETQDTQLAKNLYQDPRPNLQVFVAGLIRECLSGENPIANRSSFAHCLEVLTTLAQSGKARPEVTQLLEDLRPREVPRQPSVKPETEILKEKLNGWFMQWVSIYQRSPLPEKSFVSFITQLSSKGVLKGDEMSSLFLRVCAESSVTSYMKCIAAGQDDYAFQALDATSKLIVYMIKYQGDAMDRVNNDTAKVHYLTKILSIFILVLANFHEDQGIAFQQKPFFRFFSSLISDLHAIEADLGQVSFHLLIAVSETFSSLQPIYFPGFAFSWMCLISHRLFMPKLLLAENREGWAAFNKNLSGLFKFLAPLLKDGELRPAARDLYRGALRLLLLLLHDFPDFLSAYYFSLCDLIPPSCIQMRNVILSAYPPNIVLPDPHQLSGATYDTLPDMGPIPSILSDFSAGLKNDDLRGFLDGFLLNRGSSSFLPSLKERLKLPGATDATAESYNLPLVNALVMYVGVSSVAQAKARNGSSLFVAGDPGVVVLQYLATNLDIEGQHHLLTAMALHLRYPNAHTHWFISLMLHLFVEVNDDHFREVMTKVLLERFIVHRPHPWGALFTFIELLRNPKYDFWNKEFIHVAPEVSLLLESVRLRL